MKRKVLFLTIHRVGRSPSQRFRFEQYIDFLRNHGWEISHLYVLDEQDDIYFYRGGYLLRKGLILFKSIIKLFRGLFFESRADIVFVQREAFYLGTTIFERLFRFNSKLIFDFDDAIWIDNTSEANKKLKFLKSYAKTQRLISLSDLVIVGNSYLKSYASNYNKCIKVIPTTIDLVNKHNLIKSHENNETIIIGWTGSHTSLRYLQEITDALKRIIILFGKIEIMIICNEKPIIDNINIKFVKWSLATEIEDLAQIDIGLMPMPKEEWAKGKCGFKILQYQALGIPAIASPVGVNSEIINHGENGFLASTDDEWVECISQLIENAELRESIGKAGRKTVVDRYSVEANKHLYLKYFNELVDA